ncbi:MAG: ectoine hydroxylase-related dioxygenase (phytanoyl-CoA dioxygenase family) [Verrucomicrobiales bacterium]|jgi:ectoine hydroxylase-related dioxygenase (phytanoyl-CoA dioxygenase family)
MNITDQQIAQFKTDGAMVVRQAIGSDWLERLAAAIERDIENPAPFDHSYEVDGGRFHGNLRIWQNDPDFAAFCLDSPATGLARQFLGAQQMNLLYDQLFVKEAATDHRTRWHNDQPYWPISGRDVVSVWVALDNVDATTGRLEFVRGSHRWDRWFQPESFGPNNSESGYERNPEYEPIPDIEADRDSFDIVSWDAEPGDVYVFNGMTVHGSAGNTAPDRRRRGYTVRYCGDDVRYEPRIGVSVPLLTDSLVDGDRLDSAEFPLIDS